MSTRTHKIRTCRVDPWRQQRCLCLFHGCSHWRTEQDKTTKRKSFIFLVIAPVFISCACACSCAYSSGTAEQLWDWGAPLRTQYWGGGGGCTRRFFLLTLYNFKNIWGARAPLTPPPPPPPPLSAVPVLNSQGWTRLKMFQADKMFWKAPAH